MANSLIGQTTERYSSILGLRAVAVWLVFVHHFPPFEPGSLAFTVAKQGYVGVSIFFVLSGFLIAHRYYKSAELSWPFLKNYLYKRWLRIYPVFWLIVTASFTVIWLAGFGFEVKEYGLSISFLKGFSDENKFVGLSQTWSLTVEVCFYLLAPLLFVLHKRFGWFWRSLGFCYLMGLILWCIGIGFETLHFVAFYTFFGRAFDFFVGFGLWLICRNRTTNRLFVRMSFVSIIVFGGCIGFLTLEDYYQFDETYSNFNYTELIINNLMLPASIGLLIYKVISKKMER